MLELKVYGIPKSQGNKRFMGMSKKGHGILIESTVGLKDWRESVKLAAIQMMGGPAARRIDGPIRLEIVFTLPKPKSAPKLRRIYPDKKPDLSKLVRAAEDALSDAGAWEYDARVIDCQSGKRFPNEGGMSLPVPGVFIRIQSAEETKDMFE
jgi:Holliday junction resolvase RusA-like endonuclease